MSDLDEPAGECPKKSCGGTLIVVGAGVHADGRQVEWLQCDGCARLVEREVPLDHPSLFT